MENLTLEQKVYYHFLGYGEMIPRNYEFIVASMVSSLSGWEKELLYYYFSGLCSVNELADHFGVTKDAVRMRISKLRRKIRYLHKKYGSMEAGLVEYENKSFEIGRVYKSDIKGPTITIHSKDIEDFYNFYKGGLGYKKYTVVSRTNSFVTFSDEEGKMFRKLCRSEQMGGEALELTTADGKEMLLSLHEQNRYDKELKEKGSFERFSNYCWNISTTLTPEEKNYMKILNSLGVNLNNFLDCQLWEIRKGIRDGLSIEQIMKYASPELEVEKMKELREIMPKKGYLIRNSEMLSDVELMSIFEVKYHSEVIAEIRNGLNNGLSTEQVRKYLLFGDVLSMKVYRMLLEKGLDNERIAIDKLIIPSFSGFTIDMYQDKLERICVGLEKNTDISVYLNVLGYLHEEQYDEIDKGLANGLSSEQVSLYAHEMFDERQMREIREGFEGGLSMEQVSLYAHEMFDERQMRQIREGFESGLSMEQVKLYAVPKFSSSGMEMVRMGFAHGLTLEQVQLYANPKLNFEQMKLSYKGLVNGLSADEVALYTNPEFNISQMSEIRKGLEDGLSAEQVKQYADVKYTGKRMGEIRKGMEAGINNTCVKKDFNHYKQQSKKKAQTKERKFIRNRNKKLAYEL